MLGGLLSLYQVQAYDLGTRHRIYGGPSYQSLNIPYENINQPIASQPRLLLEVWTTVVNQTVNLNLDQLFFTGLDRNKNAPLNPYGVVQFVGSGSIEIYLTPRSIGFRGVSGSIRFSRHLNPENPVLVYARRAEPLQSYILSSLNMTVQRSSQIYDFKMSFVGTGVTQKPSLPSSPESPDLPDERNSLGLIQGNGSNGYAYFDEARGVYCGVPFDRSAQVQNLNNSCVQRGCDFLIDPNTGVKNQSMLRTLAAFNTPMMQSQHLNWHLLEFEQHRQIDQRVDQLQTAGLLPEELFSGWTDENFTTENMTYINGFSTMHTMMIQNLQRRYLNEDTNFDGIADGRCFYQRYNIHNLSQRSQVLGPIAPQDVEPNLDQIFVDAVSEANEIQGLAASLTLSEFLLRVARTFHGGLHRSLYKSSDPLLVNVHDIETSTASPHFFQDIHGYIDFYKYYWLRSRGFEEISEHCGERLLCTTWAEHTRGTQPRTSMMVESEFLDIPDIATVPMTIDTPPNDPMASPEVITPPSFRQPANPPAIHVPGSGVQNPGTSPETLALQRRLQREQRRRLRQQRRQLRQRRRGQRMQFPVMRREQNKNGRRGHHRPPPWR